MKNFFKKIKDDQRGELSFGAQILLFLVILFAVWVLLGGGQKEVTDKRLFIPINENQ
jgi:hypothetical protein